jgi:hypothetical protein
VGLLHKQTVSENVTPKYFHLLEARLGVNFPQLNDHQATQSKLIHVRRFPFYSAVRLTSEFSCGTKTAATLVDRLSQPNQISKP